jgi:ArsR family transcriptional regulator, nickel/cobalt-responsive transcriptional repressor
MDAKTARLHSKMLTAVAEPNRIRIIDALRISAKTVSELATLMKVDVVNVSHHLRVLHRAGLLLDRRVGRNVTYRLNPKHFANDGRNVMYVDLGWCRIEIPHY